MTDGGIAHVKPAGLTISTNTKNTIYDYSIEDPYKVSTHRIHIWCFLCYHAQSPVHLLYIYCSYMSHAQFPVHLCQSLYILMSHMNYLHGILSRQIICRIAYIDLIAAAHSTLNDPVFRLISAVRTPVMHICLTCRSRNSKLSQILLKCSR